MTSSISSSCSSIARRLNLASALLADGAISCNLKGFLKDLIVRKDPEIYLCMAQYATAVDPISLERKELLKRIHDLIKYDAEVFYDALFHDTDIDMAKMLSKDERMRKNITDDSNLIYGEVSFSSFYDILRRLNLPKLREELELMSPSGTPSGCFKFIDLGSGSGKAVFAARITQDFSHCIGIEILESLHQQAMKIKDRFDTHFRRFLFSHFQSDSSCWQESALELGSLLEFDWSDGNVVFMNSTCFEHELMVDIAAKAISLRPGSVLISFSKPLPNTNYHIDIIEKGRSNEHVYFEIIERRRMLMSWGPATVFFHRRLMYDGRSVGDYNFNLLPGDHIDIDVDVVARSEI